MRSLVVAVMIALVWPASNASASESGSPARRLEQGKNSYFENDFQAALNLLDRVLAEPGLTDDQRVQALQYKAFTEEVLKRHGPARATWLKLLELRPDFKIDSTEADRELIEVFKDIKPAQSAGSVDASARPSASATASGNPDALPAEISNFEFKESYRPCGIALCLVPFGVGQFVNERPIKGAVFAGLGTLFLAGNIASHLAMNNASQRYASQARIDRYYYMQNTFFGLLITTAVVGVVDAFVFP